MPVIGHTLVGIVIAQHFAIDTAARPPAAWARALWLPAIVALSYVPDLLTQAGVWFDLSFAQAAGHSLPVACVLGAAMGIIWSRLTGTSRGRAIALAATVILLHDALDLLQDVERMPLWPFSMRQVGVDWLMWTDRLAGEAIAFGLPFAAYQAWRLATKRPWLGADPASGAAHGIAGVFICGVLVVTTGLVQLRETRDAQMRRGEDLLREGRFDAALASAAAAERWPATRGRADLLRGRIYLRMGEDDRAAEMFLRAHRRTPGFWTTAALAEFHASHGPVETRRARAAPFIDALRARFAAHDRFPDVMDRIDRNLRGE